MSKGWAKGSTRAWRVLPKTRDLYRLMTWPERVWLLLAVAGLVRFLGNGINIT